MSYQVLARKWRPRLFREMVGQEHVLQALINALDNNRLHHAYLFAGTRGVGKTTIARILAKCLNCETGVSSEPCGQCSICTEIADGRFVDLIEVDAASRTKVEDTRELLENVQYAPTRGRYKVYLIDEVHMLSNSSFNALLKTLEEPPPHVKFLLATTDPQKLPVTVLSRCLQFNLKNMGLERVVEHLRFVLEQEMVPFEEAALWHLGRAADGSMRDAMSLTDQAIAFGGGKVSEGEVRAMLGTLDSALVWKLIQALAADDPAALFAAVEELSQQAPDYSGALAELAAILHRIAIAQVLPQAIDNALGDGELLQQTAATLPSENVQLFYQMALLARRDLPMAPDPRGGFEMALLRMLAFKPQGVADIPTASLPSAGEATQAQAQPAPPPAPSAGISQEPAADISPAPPAVTPPGPQETSISEKKPPVDAAPQPAAAPAPVKSAEPQFTPPQPVPESKSPQPQETPPWEDAPQSVSDRQPEPRSQPKPKPESPVAPEVMTAPPEAAPTPQEDSREALRAQLRQQVAQVESAPVSAAEPQPVKAPPAPATESEPPARLDALTPGSWPAMYPQIGVTGILHSIASHLELLGRHDNILSFTLDHSFSSLYDEGHQRRLADVLRDFFQQPLSVQIQVGEVHGGTPARLIAATKEAQIQAARESLQKDPLVQELQSELGARLDPESVEYLG
ncbi:DNA polymerase III subunit gamma/tau [Microbulbifer celer]|uniref:DNA polymerase III subunit gamma/tau n=1 Tax=Microbulbifer celer TaxID=435905 RepID=A0ABW3U488_9GAMM|nr:DNA polymerase III subunit gamma/tau [Microbulbifer celer]UFN57783.1 DNA polymerase III subunit gamma/tau [Microbulbifer celer]